MANRLRLLTQIRKAAAAIDESTSRSQIKSLLDAADVALNTLQLQESPEFYLDYIATGETLVLDGVKLIPAMESSFCKILPAGLSLRTDALDVRICEIRRALVAIVADLDESRSDAAKRYLVRMSDWESAYYTHNLEQVSSPGDSAVTSLTQSNLQGYLERRFPEWPGLQVVQFTALEGGFSKRTVLFEIEDRFNGKQAMVMRAEQPFDMLCYEGSDVTQEFCMIQLMRNSGLPTAEPLWLEADPQQLGCRFIVSRKAEGKVYGGALGSNEKLPAELLSSLMTTFIQMHEVKIAAGDVLAQKSHLRDWLPYKHSLRETTRYCVNEWLPRLIERTRIPSSPQVQRALRWLQSNVPQSDETPVVLHGDFSFNNLIIGNDGITAVLDWESSRMGDPAEDIIWTQPNVGAYMNMREFLEIYRAGTRREISEKRLAYSRVLKCVLNAVACLSAYHGLETQSSTNINLAILAYKYMGLFGSQFNSLIESAERS